MLSFISSAVSSPGPILDIHGRNCRVRGKLNGLLFFCLLWECVTNPYTKLLSDSWLLLPPTMSRIRELVVSLINGMEKKVPQQKHNSFEFAFSPIKFKKKDLQNHPQLLLSPPSPQFFGIIAFFVHQPKSVQLLFTLSVTCCDRSSSAASSQGISEEFENEIKLSK